MRRRRLRWLLGLSVVAVTSCSYPDSDWTGVRLRNDLGHDVEIRECVDDTCGSTVDEIDPVSIPVGGIESFEVQYGEHASFEILAVDSQRACTTIQDPGHTVTYRLSAISGRCKAGE